MKSVTGQILVAMSLMAFSTSLFAHQCDSTGTMPQMNVVKKHFITGGVQYADISGVNDKLTAYGLPKFNYYGPSFGFESQTIIKRLMMGGELKGYFTRDISAGNSKASFSAGQLLVTSGVELINSDRVNLYPYLGLGAGLLRLSVGATNTQFDTALAKPLPGVDVFQGKFLMDFGLGFDLIAGDGKFNGSTLGLRAGYMFDPVRKGQWWRTGSDLVGGPTPALSGAYVLLTIGKTKSAPVTPMGWKHRDGPCPMRDQKAEQNK
jgi:hypothetical protein